MYSFEHKWRIFCGNMRIFAILSLSCTQIYGRKTREVRIRVRRAKETSESSKGSTARDGDCNTLINRKLLTKTLNYNYEKEIYRSRYRIDQCRD